MNRSVCPDIPSELLLKVVEAAVESQVGHWKVAEAHDVYALAAGFFAWPDGVPHSTCDVLKEAAAKALLQKSIVRIPVSSEVGHQLRTYRTPPALEGNGSRVSRLVVDMTILIANVRGAPRDKDLAIGSRDMDLLAKAFPRLAVCTFLLHLEYHVRVTRLDADVTFENVMLGYPQYRFQRDSRQCGSLNSDESWVIGTLEESLIDFIVAFTSRGPGRRKLIRFSRDRQRSRGFGGMCLSVNHTGRQTRPLVNVTSPAILAAVDAAEGTLTTGESSSVLANARRILNKVYQGECVSC